ncbi:hypothetical protein [Leifsonia sp. 1010]|uniref:hypothetical protein n=1 Tax=Leifsonia sp. 1010 TaxID=2817769 RepID=UPI00285E01CD|nr:hypothetical protein [Leifsonia sp. 1010]MDR6610626.1 hypothetical protein [Leifsonia sp. 1010]
MTLAVKNPAISDGTTADRRESARRPRGDRPTTSFVAAEPLVDLLPPEIRAERKASGVRRVLVYSVLGLVMLVVLAAGGATALAVSEQAGVSQAQADSTRLVQQQLAFRDAQLAQQRVELAQAAQKVAGATEVDWSSYFDKFQAATVPGVAVTGLRADSASPIALYEQSTSPLQGPRIASVTFTADTTSLDPVPAWLTALSAVPGVVDVMTDDATQDPTSGVYTVHVTAHLSSAAYDERFTGKGK